MGSGARSGKTPNPAHEGTRPSCKRDHTPTSLLHPIGPVDSAGEIKAELRNHDQRITANHDSIGTLRERIAQQEVKIGVWSTEVREAREDISEMKSAVNARFSALEAKLDTELSGIRRGAWGLAFGAFTLALMAGAVAVQLLIS